MGRGAFLDGSCRLFLGEQRPALSAQLGLEKPHMGKKVYTIVPIGGAAGAVVRHKFFQRLQGRDCCSFVYYFNGENEGLSRRKGGRVV